MPVPNPKLCKHEDLPSWAHDNEFIVSGYRRPGGTNRELKARRAAAAAAIAGDKKVEGEEEGKTTAINGNGNGSARERGNGNGNGQKGNAEVDEEEEDDDDKDNAFEHDSVWKCIVSIFAYWHNETVNIHTHLWGCLSSIAFAGLHLASHLGYLPIYLFPLTHAQIFRSPVLSTLTPLGKSLRLTPYTGHAESLAAHIRTNDVKDVIGFSCFLVASIICLGFSSSFHTLHAHSRDLSKFMNRLDYIGIVVMIVGSFIPALHYGFYCHPKLQLLYAGLILLLGSLAMYTVISPKYTTPSYRPIRTSVFMALGLSAIFPVLHIAHLYGYQTMSSTMGIEFLLSSGLLYILGASLYMARIPERFSPGTFDSLGASHQIFHTCILMAAAAHYICIRRSYDFWHTVDVVGNAGATGQSQGGFISNLVKGGFNTLLGGLGLGLGDSKHSTTSLHSQSTTNKLLQGLQPRQAAEAVCNILAHHGRSR